MKEAPNYPSSSHPGPGFGNRLYVRRYTGKSYFIAAGVMFLLLPVVMLFVIITGPSQSAGYTLTVVTFGVAMGAGAAAPFVIKGRRKRGVVVEVYENGMRFASPSVTETAFLFSEVKELHKRTIRSALANLRFVLGDGRVYTVDINSPKDATVFHGVLVRYQATR